MINDMKDKQPLMLKVLQPPQSSSAQDEFFHILCQEVEGSEAKKRVELILSTEWENTLQAIHVGCDLVIKGGWERSEQQVILGEDGLVVLEPEDIITASTLAEVSFCPRAYAAKREMPPTEMNYVILIGILLHHAFAALLSSDKPPTNELLAKQAIQMHKKSIEETKFAPSEEGLKLDIRSHLERIEPWMQDFKRNHQEWEVRVEESLQSQSMGIKGRIDAMVIHPEDNSAVILELKTGRAKGLYPPLEHQIQLTCYSMLVEELILKKEGNTKCFALYSNEPDYFIEREAFSHNRRRLQAIDTRNLMIGIKNGWYIPSKENQPQCSTCRYASSCKIVK